MICVNYSGEWFPVQCTLLMIGVEYTEGHFKSAQLAAGVVKGEPVAASLKRYNIKSICFAKSGTKLEQKRNKSGTKAEQNWNKSGTKCKML